MNRKIHQDPHEYIYNKMIFSKIKEAEHLLSIYNSIITNDNKKIKTLVKEYLNDIISVLNSDEVQIGDFKLEQEIAIGIKTITTNITNILKE